MSYTSTRVVMGDVVRERGERCKDPQESGFDKFIGLEHLDTGRLEVMRYGSTDDVTTGCKICRKGDVLFGRRNPYLRRASIVNFDATCSGDIIVLMPDETKILSEYLPIVLTSRVFWKEAMSSQGGTMSKRVHMEDLASYEFNLPDMDVQKRIVDLVWSIEKQIRLLKKQIEDLDLLIKSRFIEMFGGIQTYGKRWKINKLGSLAAFKTGGTPSSKHSEYYSGTIPFISTPALGPNYIDETSAKYKITEDAIDSCSTTLIPAGSLIIGTRINVGKSSINTVDLCTNQDIVSLMNVSKKYDLLFLKHCVDQHIPYLDSQKKGCTIKGITVDLLKSINIPEPPIELQKSYVDFVKQVDKSKFELQKYIEQMMSLQISIINEPAVSGNDVE